MVKVTVISMAGRDFITEVESFDPQETINLVNKAKETNELVAIGRVVLQAHAIMGVVEIGGTNNG